MDDPNRRRRQNEPPMHATSGSRYSVQDPSQQRRPIPGNTADPRYRPAPLNTSPSQARAMGGATGNYSAYTNAYQEPVAAFAGSIAQNQMGGYASDYGQDGRPAQNYASYNPMPMPYGMPGGQGAVYDSQQAFQRQPAAGQILPTDVAHSYFQQNDPSSAAAATSLQHSQSAGTTATAYPQTQIPSYTTSMSSVGGMPAQSTSADVSMEEQDYSAGGGLEEKWMEYQTALRGIFQNVRNGVLESASQSLLEVSNWLLSQVTDLGLNLDDQNLHGDRIKLWNDFNHAWLAMFQQQKDMMEYGRQLQRTQSLITKEGLEKMGKELIRLCDNIEKHGLVDYQYGVWEEQIISILSDCLDLYEAADEAGGSGGSHAT